MISRHKSGYEKRKERQKRNEESSRGIRTQENLAFKISSKTQNDDYCDNGDIDSDPLSARSETEFVGISAQSDISTLSLYTDCANIDIGVVKVNVTPKKVEDAILKGPEPHPTTVSVEKHGCQFLTYLVSFRLKNKEIVPRDWLVWSKSKNALFCFPCRLFYKFHKQKSIFGTENGWQVNRGYKKLYDRIPDHEKSSNHKSCYIQWRNLEKNINKRTTIDCYTVKQIQNETQK
ncbi:zinc finger MYM-type protein 5-like [Hydra vulgaris]|uniref:Zinc finger MYM-type protein 5-like n=1 Tax=Hydra vulgaris TaxID=6087 RepID=A0ABM4BYU3_HYDVU